MGEALSTMSLRDLKQLENRLEKGISKIRSKKVCNNIYLTEFHIPIFLYRSLILTVLFYIQNELLYAEIEYMQKRVRMKKKKNTS